MTGASMSSLALGGVMLLGMAVGAHGVRPAFSDPGSSGLLLRTPSMSHIDHPSHHSPNTPVLASRPASLAGGAVRFRKGGELASTLMAGSRTNVLDGPKGAKGAGGGSSAGQVETAAEVLLKQIRDTAAEGSSATSSEVEESEEVVNHAIASWHKGPGSRVSLSPPPPALGLESGVSIMPHPLKAYRGGEDVALEVTVEGHTVIGVFDGVGGWAELGVDPALYARRMADLVRMEFERNPDMALLHERPLITLLQAAYDELELAELPGSCTASLALLTSEGHLHVLNVGDSGIHVVRGEECVFKTREQQHYFNCPYQLGMGSDDRPNDGAYYVLDDIAEGDMIIAATDGTWDNVWGHDVVDLVVQGGTPGEIARRVALLSHEHGGDAAYVSPFAVNSAQQGQAYRGGKLDDVTVVVSRVGAAAGGRGGAAGDESLVTSTASEEDFQE
eukprot:CAMPEP_0173391320 /NCGR_PEP_ID=MMETSP1356-20130122/18240_1 /TAXON_ID=77927 ORGANISM="Hemiselmis virescens, Strain PCC157" /NCGR_SAMPLE_ID=MMETSP1356 /ASSEMBLY_ACC=CAM_ASM_000847 /LENGTH=445 /DNA_ID=CAMNT_0014348923 /DNA_START=60 /DNA_END=1397 /DNA_ORIENTATION=-